MDHPTNTLPSDQEISHLLQQINQTMDIIRKNTSAVPADVYNQLTQTSADLEKLKGRISRVERKSHDLIAMMKIGQIVNSSLEPNEVLRLVMDKIVRLLDAERGFLMLRTPTGELSMRIARNWEQESVNPSEYAVSRTVIDRVIADGKPVLTTNAKEDPRFSHQDSIIAFNLRSIICVPLKVKDELTGVIYADNRIRSGIFTENKLDLLVAFANQAAVAIENARLFESLRNTLAEVTELKNLMDNVFTSIASGVLTLDEENKIVLCNRAAEKILMRHSSDLIGERFSDVFPSFAQEISAHITTVWENDRNFVGLEYYSDFPPRGPISFSYNLSPLKDARQVTQGVAIVFDDQTENKRLEAQRKLFERMVSPAVIEQLDPDQLQLGGHRVKITTLFADIRGFTSFSEKLDPEILVRILNQYLAAAADAVLAHEGTIDKFIGDAIMAWFNAPIPQTDHALRAVQTALDIRASITRLQDSLPQTMHLSYGAGIHFGDAVLGLVGTEKRLEFTAIGDSVNTAKRIQENAASGQILISADAYALVANHIEVLPARPIQAKGKRQPVPVYEVIGTKHP
jgi:adenylate cyclase